MSETEEGSVSFRTLPPEIYWNIFKLLPVSQLLNCRAVSTQWKDVIDELINSQEFWRRQCEVDFKSVYKDAHKKSLMVLSFQELYRSLHLWSRLSEATEEQDEFCPASIVRDEIRGLKLLQNGIIGVHKRAGILYYDVATLKPARRESISGDYDSYQENDSVIVLRDQTYRVIVYSKDENKVSHLTIPQIKYFLLADDVVYYVSMGDDMFMYSAKRKVLTELGTCTEGVLTVSICDSKLHILTCERCIYTVQDNGKLQLSLRIDSETNLMTVLYQYNMLRHLDWRLFFQWMFLLNQSVPQGLLQDIIIMHVHNNVVFVGTNWGVLRIYYKPFHMGKFDIFNSVPVKQYNFMERFDCPVLSMCQILSIECLEVRDGHIVLVAMPKKVVIISYKHNFRNLTAGTVALQGFNETIINVD